MISGIFRGGSHRKFVHVRLADEKRVFFLEQLDCSRIKRSAVVLQKTGGASGDFSLDVDVVFDRNRYAGEFAEGTARFSLLIQFLSFFDETIAEQRQKGADFSIVMGDALEGCFRNLLSCDFPFQKQISDGMGR